MRSMLSRSTIVSLTLCTYCKSAFLFDVGQTPHAPDVVDSVSEMEGKTIFGYEESQSHKLMILMTMLLLCILMMCFALGLLDMEDELWFDGFIDDDDSIPWSEIEEEMRQQFTSFSTALMGIFSLFSTAQEAADEVNDGIGVSSLDETEAHGGSVNDVDLEEIQTMEDERTSQNTSVYTQVHVPTDTTMINLVNPVATHLNDYGTMP